MILTTDQMLCPLCRQIIRRSPYLHEVFKDDFYSEWFCNLVTHYRYDHITSWRKLLRRIRFDPRTIENNAKHQYIKEKFNNKAKRQIIRELPRCKVDMSHKSGLINACTRVTIKNLKENESKWDTAQKEDACKTVELSIKQYKKVGEMIRGRHDPASMRPFREYELLYIGNDPKILDQIQKDAEAEFTMFSDNYRQAKLDVKYGGNQDNAV